VIFSRTTAARWGATGCLLLALALPVSRAAEERQPPSFSEDTSKALQNIKPLLDAKDYNGILKLLDSIPNVKPGSYDQAYILDMKAKIYMSTEQYGKAIAPAEEALKLSDQHQYFDENATLQTVNLLARLIYSEAVNVKDKAQQQAMIARSGQYLKRYLQHSKKVTPDDSMFYAQLLFAQATADPAHLNEPMLKEARQVIEDGMMKSIQPKEGFYQLLLALVQQENDYAHSAELLELAVSKFPQKNTYWPILMASYLQLAGQEKDTNRQREYYVRAINALERAQAQGQMKDPKNNYNLVTIYIAAGQFSKATDLLHEGLKKGTIESTLANWRILGSYYQQANKEGEAIEALKEAQKLFPKEGMIDLHIGEIYRGMEKTKEARDYYRSAVKKKDTLEKPHVAYQLLAFADMELDDWDEALQAITEASKYPEFQKDKQMQALKKHIEDTVQERRENEKQKQEKQKKAAAEQKRM
jgi:tetratricopeptide (TPR) repeat protein